MARVSIAEAERIRSERVHLRNRHPTILFTMDTTLYSHNDNNNIRTITMTTITI